MRKVELWSGCEKNDALLTQLTFGDSEYKTTEDTVSHKFQDICHLTHGLDQGTIDKIKDIRGHDSVAALRVAKNDGTR